MEILNKEAEWKAKKIRLLILDVDGVMTDGRIILTGDRIGSFFFESKAFDVRDGHGIKLCQREGIEVAIVTGRKSHVVKMRAKELNIKHVYQKALDKEEAVSRLLEKTGNAPEEAAYVGDDLIDIPALKSVGLAAAVSDAVPEVKQHAHIITENRGGRGAVREVCEFILKAQGLWNGVLSRYL
jgi:3-deoxy-D-manno-octulosonate 8-phosphate phosphatase (KDO 8-P phosphatase)